MNISIILSKNKLLSNFVRIIILIGVKILRATKKLAGKSSGNDIVVINFHKLGDSVFTIPALKELRRFYKKDFYIFCFEETVPIFELYFKQEYLISFKHSDFIFEGRLAKGKIRQKIKKLRPKIIFDLTGGLSTASIIYFSRANDIIGISENYFKPLYTKYIPVRKSPHIMDIYLDAVKPVIPVFNDEIKKFNYIENKDEHIIIHPFAGWKAKEWNLTKFIDLSEKINHNYKTIIVAEPGNLKDEIKKEIKERGIKIVETKNIYELIRNIERCSLIISNDSGPIYIANMLGKPTFTIYGPTNPKFHLPYGDIHRYIQKKLNCTPEPRMKSCFTDAGRNGCPSFECMNILSVEEVYTEIKLLIHKLRINNVSN